jgi:hypothetical protein
VTVQDAVAHISVMSFLAYRFLAAARAAGPPAGGPAGGLTPAHDRRPAVLPEG